MKVVKLIRNIIIGVGLVCYFSLIIFVSVLLLNRNDYGMTQFNNNTWILIDEKISNDNYPKGSLVIVEKRKIDDLQIGDEVFVYKTDEKNKTVDVIVSRIETVNKENAESSPYITLQNNGGSWGEDFVVGVSIKVYPSIGGILFFLESKWMFFIFLILPCFFILIYEIYLAIIVIKYGDVDDTEGENLKKAEDANTLEELRKQIEILNKVVSAQKGECTSVKTVEEDQTEVMEKEQLEETKLMKNTDLVENLEKEEDLNKDPLEDTIELL